MSLGLLAACNRTITSFHLPNKELNNLDNFWRKNPNIKRQTETPMKLKYTYHLWPAFN